MVSVSQFRLFPGHSVNLAVWGFSQLPDILAGTPLEPMAESLSHQSDRIFSDRPHGDRFRWEAAVRDLPDIPVTATYLNADTVMAVSQQPPGEEVMAQLYRSMQALHPWRKGPFDLFGMLIDAEWRSCLKWSRLTPHLSSLNGRVVLDVGSGNGYYLYRMLGAGASVAIGVDPTQLFLAQFKAVNHYLGQPRAVLLPLKIDDLTQRASGMSISGFDTVFSMGVYYHRRDPQSHLRTLWGFLRPGGELVLETLVIEDQDEGMLQPEKRYARMRNVWCVPSISLLTRQLLTTGFTSVRVVDVTSTTVAEQRSTAWMRFESLDNCLDPTDPTRTVEGYPAPVRACLIARR